MESGKDKVKRICEAVRKETLDPALEESKDILEKAHQEAEKILNKASGERELILHSARAEIEKERVVGKLALKQAAKQGIEQLKQQIEHLFHEELKLQVQKELNHPEILARLINTLVQKIEEEGIDTPLQALIAKSVSPSAVNALLLKNVLAKLKSVEGALLGGGVAIKLIDQKMTIDATDEVITNLLSSFIRKDLRDLLFKE